MSEGNMFSIGEYVERLIDGKVGCVKKMERWNDTTMYAVFIDRADITEDNPEGVWWGSEGAWRRAYSIHAHVDTDSQDCDSRYTGGYVTEMTLEERCDQFGDIAFKRRIVGDVVDTNTDGLLTVTEDGLSWSQRTEEGYREAEVRWCDDHDCDKQTWRRDHAAEAAGY